MNLDELRASGRATIKLWPDCAELLGLSKSVIYERARELPFVLTVGRRKLVSVPALFAWLGADPPEHGSAARPGAALEDSTTATTWKASA